MTVAEPIAVLWGFEGFLLADTTEEGRWVR